jgi:DNA-binding transcriptional LysR family regulator
VELRQLVYFEAVVRCGGFTRAAESLHIAQPAVSAQIRRLEAELGVPLLARTTRRVSLTAAGEMFLTRTRRALGELDAARGDLDELAEVLRGRVTLGATAVLGPLDLPAALATFHIRHPGVALTLRSGLVAGLLAALDAGEVDLVLGPIHTDLPSRYAARQLVEEQLVLITAPGHRLAREPRLKLADLRDEPFVCLPAGSGLRTILTTATEAEDFEPRVQFETANPTSIRELVAAGLGVALLARSAALAPGPSITIHAIDPAPVHPPIGVIHHRDHRLSPAAQTFRRHLTTASDLNSQTVRAPLTH